MSWLLSLDRQQADIGSNLCLARRLPNLASVAGRAFASKHHRRIHAAGGQLFSV